MVLSAMSYSLPLCIKALLHLHLPFQQWFGSAGPASNPALLFSTQFTPQSILQTESISIGVNHEHHGKENITVRRVWLAEANKWLKSDQNTQSSAALGAGFFSSAKSCYITYSTDVNRSSHPSQQNEEYKDIRGAD